MLYNRSEMKMTYSCTCTNSNFVLFLFWKADQHNCGSMQDLMLTTAIWTLLSSCSPMSKTQDRLTNVSDSGWMLRPLELECTLRSFGRIALTWLTSAFSMSSRTSANQWQTESLCEIWYVEKGLEISIGHIYDHECFGRRAWGVGRRHHRCIYQVPSLNMLDRVHFPNVCNIEARRWVRTLTLRLRYNKNSTYFRTKSQHQQHFLHTSNVTFNGNQLWIEGVEWYQLHLCMHK